MQAMRKSFGLTALRALGFRRMQGSQEGDSWVADKAISGDARVSGDAWFLAMRVFRVVRS
jgi:hypothetical protein